MSEMTHLERMDAAFNNEKVDRLPYWPLACAIDRKLVGDGSMTQREWTLSSDNFAKSFAEGQKKFDMDCQLGCQDLSVMASDLGAEVRMDDENTPFVVNHTDYDKITLPDVKKGRIGLQIEALTKMSSALNGECLRVSFNETPLLALSQSIGAEKLFMDMYTDPSLVHGALEITTQLCLDVCDELATTGVDAICWDYLWANYSVLGDAEYAEFEGKKYAPQLNKRTIEHGLTVTAHNCSDMPHLNLIKDMNYKLYTMAYYPLVPESPSAASVIEQGYADDCIIMGNVDPQLFVRGTVEQVDTAVKGLCQEVKTALCKRGLNSKYCLSSNCEIPPEPNTKIENISAFCNAVKKYGVMEY